MKTKYCVLPLALGLAGITSTALAAEQWVKASDAHSKTWAPALVVRNLSDEFTEYVDAYTVSNDGSNNVLHTLIYASVAAPDGLSLGTTNIGMVTNEAPSAVGWETSQRVFALGQDARIYTNSGDNGVWSGWFSIFSGMPSGGFCSGPAAVSRQPGTTEVFAIACGTHALWHYVSSATGWQSLGGDFSNGPANPPAAISCSQNTIDVMVVNRSNNHLVSRHFNGSAWQLFDSLLVTTSRVTAACNIGGNGTAFGRTGSPTQYFAKVIGPPWLTTKFIPAIAGLPTLYPALSLDDFIQAYYRTILGRIERQGYQVSSNTDPGHWLTTTNRVAPDTFSGEPNAIRTLRIDDFLVFATKSDGTLWFAHDADD